MNQFCLNVFQQCSKSYMDKVLADLSCFHDYDQEIALSSLYYLKIGTNTIAKSCEIKETVAEDTK